MVAVKNSAVLINKQMCLTALDSLGATKERRHKATARREVHRGTYLLVGHLEQSPSAKGVKSQGIVFLAVCYAQQNSSL